MESGWYKEAISWDVIAGSLLASLDRITLAEPPG